MASLNRFTSPPARHAGVEQAGSYIGLVELKMARTRPTSVAENRVRRHAQHAGRGDERMNSILANDRLQLWAGIECTVNRVRDTYRDQLVENGHAVRDDDLDRFAQLGIEAIRYPILWERTAPRGLAQADWSWADRRLNRLRSLGIAPIVGLVHHGSGPRHTHLLDPGFVAGLAEYAGAVATRYPWVEAYTPVNEPLTTARFSALYGHWYPHERSDQAFAYALVNECVATAAAMRAIRQINPEAKFVSTEDLGKTHSTPLLAYQADFENYRRWLSIDLLTGRLDQQHPLWSYIACTPDLRDAILRLNDEPCPPDVLGFNYYLTGERFLDERLERYPACSHGGNGRHQYADIEAVRVRSEGIDGVDGLLREAWERYQLPLAITEVHLGGYREEQVRWLLDSWQIAEDLRQRGVDMRAIAVWSLLGSFDWNSLCTANNGCYEPGVFDVRGKQPRPTAIARAVTQLSERNAADTTAVPPIGWWRTESRFAYPPVATGPSTGMGSTFRLRPPEAKRPLLIFGASGQLGRAFAKACKARSLPHIALTREQADLKSLDSIRSGIEQHRPWAVINAAGISGVDKAEADPNECHDVNCTASAELAAQCAAAGLPLVAFSSDHVFDGTLGRPYLEADRTSPRSAFGRSHCSAEPEMLAAHPNVLVIRTSMLFSWWKSTNYLIRWLKQLRAGQCVEVADDFIISPTYAPDLAHACLDLLMDQETGVWHLTNRGPISCVELLQRVATTLKLPCECIGEVTSSNSMTQAVVSPLCSALGSERGELLPKLDDAIRRFCIDVAPLLAKGPSVPVPRPK